MKKNLVLLMVFTLQSSDNALLSSKLVSSKLVFRHKSPNLYDAVRQLDVRQVQRILAQQSHSEASIRHAQKLLICMKNDGRVTLISEILQNYPCSRL
ncbi:hypothetical protein A3F66_04135 [candidate division TM6 bacterium RIFCSPHIGHO2_12_FULL_32_22]|nr:MAG: hypothetical protein A3F66_04135 [candidate division TM6 bacterium RIFCSPHIGHO2_12_FULL_32_22]